MLPGENRCSELCFWLTPDHKPTITKLQPELQQIFTTSCLCSLLPRVYSLLSVLSFSHSTDPRVPILEIDSLPPFFPRAKNGFLLCPP